MSSPAEPAEKTLGIDLDALSEEEYAQLVRDVEWARRLHPFFRSDRAEDRR